MSHNDSRPIGVVATGVAFGVIVGVGIALLFAPQEGAETRRLLGRRVRRARRRGQDAWLDLRDELHRARRKLRRLHRRGAVAAEDALETVDA